MDSAVRLTLLVLTAIALIYILSHQPRASPAVAPVVAAVVPYCEIITYLARKDRWGQWRYRWTPDFGLCTLLDRYENV